MMQFQAQAKSFTDAETMAAAYLAQYYGNKKVEYPMQPPPDQFFHGPIYQEKGFSCNESFLNPIR